MRCYGVSEAQEVLFLSEGTFQCGASGGVWKIETPIGSLGTGIVVRECSLEEAVGLSAEVRTGRSWLEADR